MAQTTIEQFASELKMPAVALIEQLAAAGVDAKKSGDNLTEQDKTRLLDYLRKQHGAAADPKKRITFAELVKLNNGPIHMGGRACHPSSIGRAMMRRFCRRFSRLFRIAWGGGDAMRS